MAKPQPAKPSVANRITRHADVDPAKLVANPDNWRIHPENQRQALSGVLGTVGFVQSVIVNERTGRLIDGHLRVELAVKERAATVPVAYVDLTEEEERLVLSSLDPLGSLAVTDEEKLSGLMLGAASINASFDAFMSSLVADASTLTAKSIEADGSESQPNGPRGGDPKTHIKPTIFAPQVAVFERAMRATGLVNRGEALVKICESFLATAKG